MHSFVYDSTELYFISPCKKNFFSLQIIFAISFLKKKKFTKELPNYNYTVD